MFILGKKIPLCFIILSLNPPQCEGDLSMLFKCRLKTMLMYCENDLSSYSAKSLTRSATSPSRVMLSFFFNGFELFIFLSP